MTGQDIERSEPLNGDAAGEAGAVCRGVVEGNEDPSPCEPLVSLGEVFRQFTDEVASGTSPGLARTVSTVDLANDDTWWPCSTIDGITAPIGRNPDGRVAALRFDSGGHSGALIVGPPGSGKSTLLHNFIAGATALYGPDEMELYLVDVAEGFEVYAAESLPHAKRIALRSDRESGLAVLQSVVTEMSRRAELLRASSEQHAGLAEFRRATSEAIPRVVLLIDGAHDLLSLDDAEGRAAASLLEQLIRKGGSLGVHVVLSSQSPEGLAALRQWVLECLRVRIVLFAHQGDGRRTRTVLTDVEHHLNARENGILNCTGGAIEHDEPFRQAVGDERGREGHVIAQRRLADVRGFARRPIVSGTNDRS